MSLKYFNKKSLRKVPSGFGVRQPSGAFSGVMVAFESGRGLPQSKTLPRPSELND
jgi:hypothetical protein